MPGCRFRQKRQKKMKNRLITVIIYTFLLIYIFPLNSQAAGTGSITVTVTVREIMTGVSVQAPEAQSGEQRETLTYAFVVQNIGNEEDSYRLSATSSSHWRVRLLGGRRIGPLAPGESVTVDVRITIPRRAPAGAEDQLTLTATSRTDKTIQGSGSVITTVNQVAGVRVRALTRRLRAEPGETLTHLFRIRNTGSGEDTFDLEVVSSHGWEINIPGGSTLGPLGINETRQINVEITIPTDAAPRTRDRLTLTATSQFAPEVSDSARATTIVKKSKKSKKGKKK